MSNLSTDNEAINESFSGSGISSAIKWFSEQIPGGFFIYRADDEQEILYVNKALLKIYGCETLEQFKELTGYTFHGMIHPDDHDMTQRTIIRQIGDVNNEEDLDHVEYRIKRLDGAIRWVDDNGRFVELSDGVKVYFVLLSDITEKHEIRQELNKRSNEYNGMMEQFNILADNSLTVLRANLTKNIIEDVRGLDLYGCDRRGANVKEYINSRSASFLNVGDAENYVDTFRRENLVERYYEGRGPATFVGYCKRPSGRQCFVNFSATAVIDPVSGDTIVFAVETEYNNQRITDILNKKVLVQQYDLVAYIVGDNYGVVIGAEDNDVKGSIFPKERDGSYSRYMTEQVLPAVPESDRERIGRELSSEEIVSRLENEESYTVDVNCLIHGETFNKRFTFYPVDKSRDFYILLKSDITDVIRKEHQMYELVSRALRDAENANAAKTAFLSNMSHEIRTPMNAIVGLDSIALQIPDLPDSAREYLEKIGASAKHLLAIINDILDMSRIESGRMVQRKEEFSFSDMLEQINTLIQSQCSDKGLNYECRVSGRIDRYYIGDDMKLKQVLLNILSNAIKFTEAPGSVTMTIEETARFENNSTLCFSVKDTGIGIDKDFLPKIFEPFSQENTNRTTKYGSTGLGMAITKNIVEMMNGTMTVESEKDKGTEFSVTLTLLCCDKTDLHAGTIDPKDVKVLVIDDDPIACKHAQLVMEEVGIASDIAQSGMEALSMIEIGHAKQEPYNLILVDWKMPEYDGVEISRRIREKYDDKMTIIILTAYNWDDIVEEAVQAGVDSFMSKPLFAANILSEFERVLKQKHIGFELRKELDLSGKHILLAEDVMINAEIMENILSMRNINVDHAQNGKEAVELFKSSDAGYYDAVLMDVRMPEMDGLEATKAIRALDRSDAGSIPIIAMTANAFDEDVQNSLQAGMDAHLSKPVEMDHLFSTLQNLIGKNNSGK